MQRKRVLDNERRESLSIIQSLSAVFLYCCPGYQTGLFEYHWWGNLGNLASNEEIQLQAYERSTTSYLKTPSPKHRMRTYNWKGYQLKGYQLKRSSPRMVHYRHRLLCIPNTGNEPGSPAQEVKLVTTTSMVQPIWFLRSVSENWSTSIGLQYNSQFFFIADMMRIFVLQQSEANVKCVCYGFGFVLFNDTWSQ